MGAEPHVVADAARLDAAIEGVESAVYVTLGDAGYIDHRERYASAGSAVAEARRYHRIFLLRSSQARGRSRAIRMR